MRSRQFEANHARLTGPTAVVSPDYFPPHEPRDPRETSGGVAWLAITTQTRGARLQPNDRKEKHYDTLANRQKTAMGTTSSLPPVCFVPGKMNTPTDARCRCLAGSPPACVYPQAGLWTNQ